MFMSCLLLIIFEIIRSQWKTDCVCVVVVAHAKINILLAKQGHLWEVRTFLACCHNFKGVLKGIRP